MALVPRDTPITRDQVQAWLDGYSGNFADQAALRTYLTGKINDLDMADTEINTSAHDDLGDTTPVVEMILMDLESYAIS